MRDASFLSGSNQGWCHRLPIRLLMLGLAALWGCSSAEGGGTPVAGAPTTQDHGADLAEALSRLDQEVAGAPDDWRPVMLRADVRLKAGQIPGAIDDYDRLIDLRPEIAPQLWQRGIALYYAERWNDCIEQFVSHRTVNPNDVENAAWHFLCVARRDGVAAARAAILPVGPDARVPMGQVYELYAGRGSVEAVREEMARRSGGSGSWDRFYGELYLGLLAEVEQDAERAAGHLRRAHTERFPHYMGDVARVHLQLRGWDSSASD